MVKYLPFSNQSPMGLSITPSSFGFFVPDVGFVFFLCRDGSIVRNPSGVLCSGVGSELVGFYAG